MPLCVLIQGKDANSTIMNITVIFSRGSFDLAAFLIDWIPDIVTSMQTMGQKFFSALQLYYIFQYLHCQYTRKRCAWHIDTEIQKKG
jgi:hypothetical protein